MGLVVVGHASGILADRLPAHGTIIGMESRRQAEKMLTEDPGIAGNNNNVEAINDSFFILSIYAQNELLNS